MTVDDIIAASGAETRAGWPILRFATAAALGAWLSTAPRTAGGVWLMLARKGAVTAGLSRPDAVDALLCHGWIDGQQDRYDAASWLIRVTPRRRGSRWSQVNRDRATALIAAGQMHPAGLAEIAAARADGRWDAAYAPASTAAVPPDLQARLDASPPAARSFAALNRTDRYAVLYGIAVAKRPETRARRIAAVISTLRARAKQPARPARVGGA